MCAMGYATPKGSICMHVRKHSLRMSNIYISNNVIFRVSSNLYNIMQLVI